jgi:hypothetical protein
VYENVSEVVSVAGDYIAQSQKDGDGNVIEVCDKEDPKELVLRSG